MRCSRAALTPQHISAAASLQNGAAGSTGIPALAAEIQDFGKSHCSKQSLLLPGSAGLEAGEFCTTSECKESL